MSLSAGRQSRPPAVQGLERYERTVKRLGPLLFREAVCGLQQRAKQEIRRERGRHEDERHIPARRKGKGKGVFGRASESSSREHATAEHVKRLGRHCQWFRARTHHALQKPVYQPLTAYDRRWRKSRLLCENRNISN